MSVDANRTARLLPLVGSSRFVAAAVHSFTPSFRLTIPTAERTHLPYRTMILALLAAGAWIRFWGLGSVGLHGDEETMAMAVRGILREGVPILPSGMLYPRGITQLYLMSLSVWMFGESEWALRLPSAVCGIVLIAIAHFVGKRFLRPEWNVAFVAAIAFLPALVVYSQTARMYIFLVTCIAATMALVFAWERTGAVRWLIGAVAVLILGMDMQVLAVAAVLLFLIPGLLHSDARRLLQGIAAIAMAVLAFIVIDRLVESQYPVPPPEFTASLPQPTSQGASVSPNVALEAAALLYGYGALLAYVCWQVVRTVDPLVRWPVAVLLLAGLTLQLALFYHLAALSYVAGAALVLRNASPSTSRWLTVFGAGVVLLTGAHVILVASQADTIVRLVGALVGQPSVWPYVRAAQLSVAAGVVCGSCLVWGIYRLARNRDVPDYWLLALLAVWAPVFALGLFAWNVPPRYTAVALLPMLVCAFATLQGVSDALISRAGATAHKSYIRAIVAIPAAICIVNPIEAAATIRAGYGVYPDHKGTAEFLLTQYLREDDIVIAEDVLQQTYYLGKVDYWLIGPDVARRFVMSRNGEAVDFYTGTPVIVSEAMLDLVLLNNADRRVFLLLSGERQEQGRRSMRGPELHAAVTSSRFETMYVGRDGLSKVLRAVPKAVAHTSATGQRSGYGAVDESSPASTQPYLSHGPRSADGTTTPE